VISKLNSFCNGLKNPVGRRLACSAYVEQFGNALRVADSESSRAEALGHKTRRSPGCFCRALRMGFQPGYRVLTTRASIYPTLLMRRSRQSENSVLQFDRSIIHRMTSFVMPALPSVFGLPAVLPAADDFTTNPVCGTS